MKLVRTTAFTAALMTAAVMSLTSPAQAQARLAWWGWPGLVAGYGNGYGTGFGYAANSYAPAYTGYGHPVYAYGYGSSYGYPASRYAYHPVVRRHIASRPRIRDIYAAGAGVRRHWQ